MRFTDEEYHTLHRLTLAQPYPGHKPGNIEYPNGDGRPGTYRYAHIAPKYLPGWGSAGDRAALLWALTAAHVVAEQVYDALGGPQEFRPDIRYGALRVLEYEPGAHAPEHKDFDLFTLHLYRDPPDTFHRASGVQPPSERALAINPGLHLGELGDAIGLGQAMPHWVTPTSGVQRSIVYFAIPDHDAVLPRPPDGQRVTVREWLNDRMTRSRTAHTAYKAGQQ